MPERLSHAGPAPPQLIPTILIFTPHESLGPTSIRKYPCISTRVTRGSDEEAPRSRLDEMLGCCDEPRRMYPFPCTTKLSSCRSSFTFACSTRLDLDLGHLPQSDERQVTAASCVSSLYAFSGLDVLDASRHNTRKSHKLKPC